MKQISIDCAGKGKREALKSGDVIAINKWPEYSCMPFFAQNPPLFPLSSSQSMTSHQLSFARAVFTFVDQAAQAAELSRFPQEITDRYVVLSTLGSCACLTASRLHALSAVRWSARSATTGQVWTLVLVLLCAAARTARCVWCVRAAPAWRAATRSRSSTRSA